MAPEVIKAQPYDSKVDVWSAGVIVYYLINGELPFSGSNREELNQKIIAGDLKMEG